MKRIILLLLVLVHCALLQAQRYSFYNLGVESGLIQSQVRALLQDDYGHLWIGTWGGLSRYDGTAFTNYNVRNGMVDNTVLSIAADEQGNIWLGSPEGISVYNGRRFEHYTLETPENTSAKMVRELKRDKDAVYCRTDSNVYRVKDRTIQKIKLPGNHLAISAMLPMGDTLVVAATGGRVYRYYNNRWDSLFYHVPGYDKPPVFTTKIFRDSRNDVFFATTSGLFRLQNDSIKVVTVNGLPMYNIPFISMAEGADSTLWLGSTSGAYSLKNGIFKRYSKNNGFTDNAITAIISDKEGNVWFGSDGQGLYRFSGAQFSILDEKSGLPSEQVMSFAPTPSGNLYIGTADAGLYYYNNESIIPIALRNNDVFVSTLLPNSEYDIWVGTNREGLWRLKGPERIYYNTPEVPGDALIISLYPDTSGRIWIGMGRGAAYYSNNRFTKVPVADKDVFAFAALGTDSILMATREGLKLYHDNTVTGFITGAAPDSAHPQCLVVQDSKLWVGTSDNGIICYDLVTKTSFTLNKGNGLRSDFIYNIIADDNGDIWAGTGFGIHKIHMEGYMPHVTFFGKEQGITGMESNQNAVCKMPDGTLWFGTTKGAVHINPDKELIQPRPVSIVLQSVKVFGDEIRDTSYYDSTDLWYNVPYSLRLPHKKNNITFTFKAISLLGAEQLMYRYHMEGLDAPWSDWTPINSVTYSALPPGKYKLQVESKTINSNEVKKLTYPFEIITPLHKTTWFSFAIFLACILAGITIQYVLNRRKQNRLALVEKLRREEQGKVRQRTAEDFHDEVGNKLTRINVLTNVLKEKLGPVSPDKARIIDQIQESTTQLYSGTRDILWSLQETNDRLYEIIHRIRDFGMELFDDTGIHFEFSESDDAWKGYRLPLDMSRNLIMIFKEALNNSLKYSGATEVKLEAELRENDVLHIALTDNGKGYKVEEVVKGNGLNNMRNRAERLKGKLYIDSKPGEGTSVHLHFRLQHRIKPGA